MTISKRVRFEILRRDENTCQYCGQSAPDVVLHIDHVVPVALGGLDDPSNLLTACRDCNLGKTSIQPDSPLVARVSDHAAAYALGMLDKLTHLRADLEREKQWERDFLAKWNTWTYTSGGDQKSIPLPPDWQSSIVRWNSMGIPELLFDKAIRIAMEKRGLRGEFIEFTYMAGVIWRTVERFEVDYDLTPEHAVAYTLKDLKAHLEAARDEAYNDGWHDGGDGRELRLEAQDYLRHHIDGDTDHWALRHVRTARRGT